MKDGFLVWLFSYFWRDSRKYHLMIGERMILRVGDKFIPIDFSSQGSGYFIITDPKFRKALGRIKL